MTDYIEREALLEAISKIGGSPLSEWDTVGVVSLVANQPAADVAPVRRGQWIEDKNTFPGFNLANNMCSECGECAGTWPKRLSPRDKYAFCPWCGARMDVPNDD